MNSRTSCAAAVNDVLLDHRPTDKSTDWGQEGIGGGVERWMIDDIESRINRPIKSKKPLTHQDTECLRDPRASERHPTVIDQIIHTPHYTTASHVSTAVRRTSTARCGHVLTVRRCCLRVNEAGKSSHCELASGGIMRQTGLSRHL